VSVGGGGGILLEACSLCSIGETAARCTRNDSGGTWYVRGDIPFVTRLEAVRMARPDCYTRWCEKMTSLSFPSLVRGVCPVCLGLYTAEIAVLVVLDDRVSVSK